jgi:hypothetical protein
LNALRAYSSSNSTGNAQVCDGFALQPWSHVRFDNQRTMIEGGLAFVMSNHSFTDANSGQETKEEFTFGIKRADDGCPVIFLHQSSLPYAPEK